MFTAAPVLPHSATCVRHQTANKKSNYGPDFGCRYAMFSVITQSRRGQCPLVHQWRNARNSHQETRPICTAPTSIIRAHVVRFVKFHYIILMKYVQKHRFNVWLEDPCWLRGWHISCVICCLLKSIINGLSTFPLIMSERLSKSLIRHLCSSSFRLISSFVENIRALPLMSHYSLNQYLLSPIKIITKNVRMSNSGYEP